MIDIRTALNDRHIVYERLPHPPMDSALDEARVLGVDPSVMLKAVLLETAQGPVLAVLPATRRVDIGRVRELLGDPHARLATEPEVEARFPEIELGALPPLGSALGIPLLADARILEEPVVVFDDGVAGESLRSPAEALFAGERAMVGAFGVPVEAGT